MARKTPTTADPSGAGGTSRPADSELSFLQTIAQREQALLAPYAMRSMDTRGRKYEEPEQIYRGPFQRDRDRLLHSGAFRRLSGKMQVFTGDMGDYHRTRLTHTHEVASIARTIGRALRLNEDLIEALALFHDIGHPPYGHCGEELLHQCLAEYGGFSHNRFALTIAEELETRYLAFPGLNLTWEVLESQATRVHHEAVREAPLLEAQVVEAADSITYSAHDSDDAVKLGFVTLDELATTSLIREVTGRLGLHRLTGSDPRLRKAIVHELINHQVTDVLQVASRHLATHRFATAAEARESSLRIGPSEDAAAQKRELEAFLFERVYRHPRLLEVRAAAQGRLRTLFTFYASHSDELPAHFRQRSAALGPERCAGEYLASMTDRFCEQQYRRLAAHGVT